MLKSSSSRQLEILDESARDLFNQNQALAAKKSDLEAKEIERNRIDQEIEDQPNLYRAVSDDVMRLLRKHHQDLGEKAEQGDLQIGADDNGSPRFEFREDFDEVTDELDPLERHMLAQALEEGKFRALPAPALANLRALVSADGQASLPAPPRQRELFDPGFSNTQADSPKSAAPAPTSVPAAQAPLPDPDPVLNDGVDGHSAADLDNLFGHSEADPAESPEPAAASVTSESASADPHDAE